MRLRNRRGLALIFVLIVLVALSGVTLAFWYMTDSGLRTAGVELADAQAFYLAEAGRRDARYALTTGGSTPPYTQTNVSLGNGVYTVSAVYSDPPTNNYVTITSAGYVPNSTKPVAHRQVVESNILIGGSNLSLASAGTTITSSGDQGGNPASQAIDGGSSTGWISSNKQNSWLQLNYGSAKTVARVVVSGSKITSIVVQYSNDNNNWTAVSNPSGALPGTRTFTAVSARYLMLNITSGANEKAQVNEFESYAGSGGATTLGQGKFATSL